jgi:hypothetical protein
MAAAERVEVAFMMSPEGGAKPQWRRMDEFCAAAHPLTNSLFGSKVFKK